MKKVWFRKELFGWMWRPASWEGWAVTGFFLAIILLLVGTFDHTTTFLDGAIALAVPVLLFVSICFMTDEVTGERTEDDSRTV